VLDLARFFSCSFDLGFVTDAHGAVLAATPGAERALGYSQAELKGVDLSTLDEGGDLRRFFESSPTRSRMNLGFHLRTRSGAVLALNAMASCLRDEQGIPRGWFLAGQDLNGALAESREEPTILDALVDSIGAAVWSFDRNGQVLTWGRSCEAAFGIPKARAEGRMSVVTLFESPAEFRRVLEAVDQQGRFSGELPLRGQDGAARTNHVSMTPLISGGHALGYTCVSFDVTEQKREGELRRSLFDQAGEAIIVVDFETLRVADVNGRACEIYGYRREEFLNLPVAVLRVAGVGATDDEIVRSLREKGGFVSDAEVGLRRDGTRFPCALNIRPFTVAGKLYSIAVQRDLTAQRRAEEFFRALFDQAGEAIVVVDLTDRRVIDVNGRACEIYGYSHEEFFKLDAAELRLNPVVPVEEIDRRLRETGRYESERETGRRKDGTGFPCALNIRRIQPGGKEYTVAVVRDLTAQRRAEEFFRVLFEKASDAIFLVEDQSQQVVEANEAACRLLGYSREEFLRLKIPDLVPPEFRHRISRVRQNVSEGGFQRDRRMLLRKDGTSVPTDHTITKLDVGGRIFYLASCRDLTTQESAAQELEEAKAFLEHVQENASDGIALLDEKGVYLSVNQRLLSILGARREDMIGRTYQSRTDPGAHEEYAAYWRRLMNGELITMRTPIVRPDGRPIVCEVSASSVRRGTRTFVFSIVRDVTDQAQEGQRLVHARDELERRVAERTAELQKSEERFRAAFTQGGIGMALVGLDGRFLQVNRTLLDLIGYSEQDLLQKTFREITHPEDQDRSIELARHMIRDRQLFARLEKRYLHRNGQTIWFDLSTTLVQGPSGEDLYFVTSFQDITDRKKAEEKVRQSEARFRAITEATPVPTTITRLDGEILFVNESAARLFGVGRDEAPGRLASDFYADQADRVIMRDRLLQEGELNGYELRLRRGDGTPFWTVVNLRIVTFEGSPAIFGSFVDIDARKRAEEALRESEGRYRALAENTGVGVWQITEDGRSVYANPAMLSILGLSRMEELAGRTIRDFFPAEILDRIGAEFHARPTGTGFSMEGEVIRPGGTRRQVVLFGAPMPSPDGVPRTFIGSVIDITERKRAEIELRESEERFRAITEGVPVAVVIARASDGTILYGNEQAVESLGLAPGMLEGRSIPEFLAQPEQRTQLRERLNRLGSVQGLEIQFRRNNGALFWGAASLRVASFRGEPVTLGVFSDITARKESEVLLKKAHEELEQRVLERTAELARANELLQEEISERKRAENALRLILEGTAAVTGGSFFRSLARHLATALNVRCAVVAHRTGKDSGSVSTDAFWNGTEFVGPLDRGLAGTPCEDVIHGEACSYGHDVQRLFPQDRLLVELEAESYMGVPIMDSTGDVVGLLSVLDVRPASDEERKLSVLKIFAARAGAELERQRGEEALRESEERWRSLVHNAPDYILTVGRDFRILSVNRLAPGLILDQFLGKSVLDFIPPHDHENVRRSLEGVFRDGTPGSYETQAPGADGVMTWYYTRVGPVVLRGAVVEATMIATDITDRRQAENRQRVQHEVTKILADAASLDAALHEILARVCQTMDWSAGLFWRVKGGGLGLADSWSAPEAGPREFLEACRDRIPVLGEGNCGRAWKDGSLSFLLDVQTPGSFDRPEAAARAGLHGCLAIPLVDAGVVFGILEFFTREVRPPDEALVRTLSAMVSQLAQFMERKRAQEALWFQKSLLESQSEAALDGILVVSREGVMVSFNRRFGQIWDVPEEILQARTDERALQFVLEKVLHPEQFLARVRHLYDHPNEESRDEILLKDGRTFDRYSAPVKGGQGAVYGRVWYFRDVTGRKQTEENLRRAAEETRRAYDNLKEAQAQLIRSEKLASIGMLVSGVAHEINNPLNVMYGNLQLLAEVSDVLLPLAKEGAKRKKVRGMSSRVSKFRGMIRDALKAARHAREIVRDFRNFARDTRTAELVDLNECLEEAVTLIQRELRPGIRVVRKLGRIPQVRCLRGQMSQVFLNLLKNAEEAIEKKGTVTLRTQRKDGRVVVEVIDTGRGMPEEVRRKLFEPFFTTKPVGKGLGLGLSISAMIVQNHNGRITVRSRPGHGSVFKVELPLTS
jgi:PAS domain S-box-containing protein